MQGKWPLHEASAYGDSKAVALLLEKGADVNSQIQSTNNTPLHEAIYSQKTEVINLLLAHPKTNINIQNVWGMSPLHYSLLYSDDITLLRSLLDLKADVNLQDIKGRTPCHSALQIFSIRTVSVLLESKRVDIYVRNKEGMNLVQFAEHELKEKEHVHYIINDIKREFGPSKADALAILLGASKKNKASSVYQFSQNCLYDRQVWRIVFDFAGIPRTKYREIENNFTFAGLWKNWSNFWTRMLNPPTTSKEEKKSHEGQLSTVTCSNNSR